MWNYKKSIFPHPFVTPSPTAPPRQTPPTTDRLLSQYQELAYNRSKACGPCTYNLSHPLLGLAHRMTQTQLLLLLLYSARLSQGAAHASSKVPTPTMACHPPRSPKQSLPYGMASHFPETTQNYQKLSNWRVWNHKVKWGCCRTVPASRRWEHSLRVRGAASRASLNPAGDHGPPAASASHSHFIHEGGFFLQ